MLFESCDLFLSRPEGNLMDDVRAEVWAAKAPQLSVYMDLPTAEGVSSPVSGMINMAGSGRAGQ
jgi:hypothetical protein